MNTRTMGMLGLMGAMAAATYEFRGSRPFDVPSQPRLRHARKVHPRRNDHLKGAWKDPAWNAAEAERQNIGMGLDRAAHKARVLEEGREILRARAAATALARRTGDRKRLASLMG